MVMALRLGLAVQRETRSSKERGFDPHPSHFIIFFFFAPVIFHFVIDLSGNLPKKVG